MKKAHPSRSQNLIRPRVPRVGRAAMGFPISIVRFRLPGAVISIPVLILILVLGARSALAQEATVTDSVRQDLEERLAATTHCTPCHAFPKAEHLDRTTWERELLPKMRIFMGLDPATEASGFKDLDILKREGVFPKEPMVSEESFLKASRYFLKRAPERTRSIQDQDRIVVGLKTFEVEVLSDRHDPPLTTLVHIDGDRRELILGDAGFQGYNVLDSKLGFREGLPIGNIPVSVVVRRDEHWVAAIGHFFPREDPRGQVLHRRRNGTQWTQNAVLSDLPRTTDVQLADLNGDGRLDLIVCMYGNHVGRFSWFENLASGGYKEHVLWDRPGAIRSEVRDLNGNGHPDLMVLVAQETEAVFAFEGDGRGTFERRLIYQKDPSWGHSGFELVDFDGDGRLDLLVTNGDNADFNTSPPRPHHGIRIFQNRGDWKFEEVWFAPMNGAYRAVARDFDQDGDLDIAAISFFPDYDASPRESFIYFENVGGRSKFEFRPYTFPECIAGRWLTLAAGDLDGDGDEDLVLGSLIQMPTKVPPFLKEMWEKQGPSILVLRNKTR